MIYAGASGVGSAAIQIASLKGAKVFATCSSQPKIEFCQKFLFLIVELELIKSLTIKNKVKKKFCN
jgi:NADPH:quinone reductase-like Zn-dependent oxidoreductase